MQQVVRNRRSQEGKRDAPLGHSELVKLLAKACHVELRDQSAKPRKYETAAGEKEM